MQATNVLTKFDYPKIYFRSILHACTAMPYFHIFLRLHHCPIFYVFLFFLLGLLQVILLGKKKQKQSMHINRDIFDGIYCAVVVNRHGIFALPCKCPGTG